MSIKNAVKLTDTAVIEILLLPLSPLRIESAFLSQVGIAPMESFFGHMKDELDYKQAKTFEELKQMIDQYMAYYNESRGQWNLKRMTPIEYQSHLIAA